MALWRCWMGKKKADLVLSVNVNMSAEDGQGQLERERVEGWWLRSVGSLKLKDWNLFGDSE